MNAIAIHNDSFFKALQSNAVLIDSDLVGAARLLWTARAAELNLDIYREKLSFHFRGDQEEVYRRIEEIFRQQYAFRSPIQNLYEHQKRGRLFYSIGVREKRVEGVSNRESVPEYLPFYQVEVGYFSKESPNFDIVISSALSKSTLVDADITLHLTEWKIYRELDLVEIKGWVKSAKMIDGRNALDSDKYLSAGWRFRALGRNL